MKRRLPDEEVDKIRNKLNKKLKSKNNNIYIFESISLDVTIYLSNINNKELCLKIAEEVFSKDVVFLKEEKDCLQFESNFSFKSERDAKEIISKGINKIAERLNTILQYKINSCYDDGKVQISKNLIKNTDKKDVEIISAKLSQFLLELFQDNKEEWNEFIKINTPYHLQEEYFANDDTNKLDTIMNKLKKINY